MSEFKEIKKKILNEDKVEYILECIGCEFVNKEQGGELVTARLPERFNSQNKRSVQVKMNASLTSSIRSRGDFEGDIFKLILYIHFDKRGKELDDKKNQYEAKDFICKKLGWGTSSSGGIIVKDYTATLRELIGDDSKNEIKKNPVIPENIMNQFYFKEKPLPYKKWIDEGISYNTQVLYNVGFDWDSKRVVFPLRNKDGALVGVKGRIMRDEDDLDRKYLYLYRCNNRYEWFNWYLAVKYILKEKKVYIFEAEKSCMKAWNMGFYNTLAIGASDITPEQVAMLKGLGEDIQIILCYDKDKTVEEIEHQAEKIRYRTIYYVFDIDNKLGKKDSPVDNGLDIWNYLLENNIYEFDK